MVPSERLAPTEHAGRRYRRDGIAHRARAPLSLCPLALTPWVHSGSARRDGCDKLSGMAHVQSRVKGGRENCSGFRRGEGRPGFDRNRDRPRPTGSGPHDLFPPRQNGGGYTDDCPHPSSVRPTPATFGGPPLGRTSRAYLSDPLVRVTIDLAPQTQHVVLVASISRWAGCSCDLERDRTLGRGRRQPHRHSSFQAARPPHMSL